MRQKWRGKNEITRKLHNVSGILSNRLAFFRCMSTSVEWIIEIVWARASYMFVVTLLMILQILTLLPKQDFHSQKNKKLHTTRLLLLLLSAHSPLARLWHFASVHNLERRELSPTAQAEKLSMNCLISLNEWRDSLWKIKYKMWASQWPYYVDLFELLSRGNWCWVTVVCVDWFFSSIEWMVKFADLLNCFSFILCRARRYHDEISLPLTSICYALGYKVVMSSAPVQIHIKN